MKTDKANREIPLHMSTYKGFYQPEDLSMINIWGTVGSMSEAKPWCSPQSDEHKLYESPNNNRNVPTVRQGTKDGAVDRKQTIELAIR